MENKLYFIIGKNFEGTSWYVGENADYDTLSDGCTWNSLEEAQARIKELSQDNPNNHQYTIEDAE